VSASNDAGQIPADLLYTNDHEWVRREGDEGTIGITHFAQDQLGDVVYLDLPAVGSEITAGERFGEIESVKTVSDLFAPVGGEVLATNDEIVEHPELVNSAPYGGGWLVRIRIADEGELEGLLTAEAYGAQLPDL
jgi:glycine cleavage system H protein